MLGKNKTSVCLPILLTLCSVLAGCATAPVKFEQPATPVSITEVLATIKNGVSLPTTDEAQVLWGGTVLSVSNLTDSTRVEIIAHPLDSKQKPMTGSAAQGRFYAIYKGFVEPLNFPLGRVVTLLGSLSNPIRGTVGEVEYVYPSINVIDSHLWTAEELAPRTPISFGIGINLGL